MPSFSSEAGSARSARTRSFWFGANQAQTHYGCALPSLLQGPATTGPYQAYFVTIVLTN